MEILANPDVLNCYHVLKIAVSATEEEIKRSYRRLALRFHPDRNGNTNQARQAFQQVQHAYEVLRDPVLRHYHDMELALSLTQEEYLNRFQDLILTASGLGLRCEGSGMCLANSQRLAVTQSEFDCV
eukprot:TRINITY_DN2213_c0_g2_i7.p2 TRINITY_DN2213_c0_g2~~TRINITY_DN2213_c0_g2_i7.p2  ORF type:complete len:127 (-),score=5.60 TRINITY_DN2213_c0_g2_i7:251-631(-)